MASQSVTKAIVLMSLPMAVHPIRVGVWTTVFYAIVTFAGFVLPSESNAFFFTFLLHTVVSGVYFAGTSLLAPRFLPQAKFAQFASAASLLTALGVMMLTPMLGALIEFLGHQYHYAFLLAALLSALSAGSFLLLLRGYISTRRRQEHASSES